MEVPLSPRDCLSVSNLQSHFTESYCNFIHKIFKEKVIEADIIRVCRSSWRLSITRLRQNKVKMQQLDPKVTTDKSPKSVCWTRQMPDFLIRNTCFSITAETCRYSTGFAGKLPHNVIQATPNHWSVLSQISSSSRTDFLVIIFDTKGGRRIEIKRE